MSSPAERKKTAAGDSRPPRGHVTPTFQPQHRPSLQRLQATDENVRVTKEHRRLPRMLAGGTGAWLYTFELRRYYSPPFEIEGRFI